MNPRKNERTSAHPDEPYSGRDSLAPGVTVGVLATAAGFLILSLEALGPDLLLNTLIVAAIYAATVAGVRLGSVRTFFSRRKTPAGVKRPAVTKSNSGAAEEERHPLRNGDGIPHAHLWWF